MSRFFMHLHDGIDLLLDEDGIEMAVEAIPSVALLAARDCIAGDVRSHGRIDLKCRIDVQDAGGFIVHTLRFADAVEILPPTDVRKS